MRVQIITTCSHDTAPETLDQILSWDVGLCPLDPSFCPRVLHLALQLRAIISANLRPPPPLLLLLYFVSIVCVFFGGVVFFVFPWRGLNLPQWAETQRYCQSDPRWELLRKGTRRQIWTEFQNKRCAAPTLSLPRLVCGLLSRLLSRLCGVGWASASPQCAHTPDSMVIIASDLGHSEGGSRVKHSAAVES